MEFSNREISSIFWMLVFFCWIASKQDVRKSIRELIKALTAPVILQIFSLVFLYVLLSHLLFEWLSTWPPVPIKNFIYWLFASAFIAFHQISVEAGSAVVRFIKDSIGLAVVFEYVVTLAEFPLWIEFITVPLFSLIIVMVAFTEKKPEYGQVHAVFSGFQVFGGIAIIIAAGVVLSFNIEDYLTQETYRDFLYPMFMAIAFALFLAAFQWYLRFEKLIVRANWIFDDSSKSKSMVRKALRAFGLKTQLVDRWLTWVQRIDSRGDEELIDLMNSVIDAKRIENEKTQVPFEKGWSVRDAMRMLRKERVVIEKYDQYYDNVWGGTSNSLRLVDDVISDRIDYRIDGERVCVECLELRLTINDFESCRESVTRFQELSIVLFQNAFPKPVALEFSVECNENKVLTMSEQGKEVKFQCERSSVKNNHWMHLLLTVQIPGFERFPESRVQFRS